MVFFIQKYNFNSDRKLNLKKVLTYGKVVYFLVQILF